MTLCRISFWVHLLASRSVVPAGLNLGFKLEYDGYREAAMCSNFLRLLSELSAKLVRGYTDIDSTKFANVPLILQALQNIS